MTESKTTPRGITSAKLLDLLCDVCEAIEDTDLPPADIHLYVAVNEVIAALEGLPETVRAHLDVAMERVRA